MSASCSALQRSFAMVISHPEKMPRLAQRFDETGHSWVWGHRTPTDRSLAIRVELKAAPQANSRRLRRRRGCRQMARLELFGEFQA